MLFLAPFSADESLAQASDSLSFQGRLTDDTGEPINDPSVQITFKLYKNGTAVWTEVHPSVAVVDGIFNVILGGTTPLNTVKFNVPIELGITVEGDPEISPRTPLTAAAFAKALPGLYTFYNDDGFGKSYTVIGGGTNNVVSPDAVGATIGGGGGIFNNIPLPNTVTHDFATIGGGSTNVASAVAATVGGGGGNTASGADATVAGGRSNTASGLQTTVGGGSGNKAIGTWATIPGGKDNRARGTASFAAGYQARANHHGTFVWADHSLVGVNDTLASTGENQFLIRAAGGVGIGTRFIAAGAQLDINGPIHFRDDPIFFKGTNLSGTPDGDGVRVRWAENYGGANVDYLVFEKTDGNTGNPDGGFVFVNTGNDGVGQEAFRIAGTGSAAVAGNFNVGGTLSKGGGAFKIDHPLDPEGKFLYHSFVESPDMKNVYDGVVRLDDNGKAEVELPSYFEALNRDFRYQLTPIGSPGPNLFVAGEIAGGIFRIAGGEPGTKVSWQVTGIRKDPYAEMNRIEVEVEKAAHEQGTYLHPEAYGATQ